MKILGGLFWQKQDINVGFPSEKFFVLTTVFNRF